jgi:nicotinate-nucleotide adenylyltransferase
MKIGLYFGSFNPIHNGHLIIAVHVLDNTDLQQIWFMVSPHNPLKETSTLLNEQARYYMVQQAIEDNDHFRANNLEFKLPRPSYTIDTLTYMDEKFPQHEFSVIVGGDSLQNLPKWKNYEQLLANYRLYVYARPGIEEYPVQHQNIILIQNAPQLAISATLIREKIKLEHSIRYLVPDKVIKIINESRYYK